jgi:hypothetical protein
MGNAIPYLLVLCLFPGFSKLLAQEKISFVSMEKINTDWNFYKGNPDNAFTINYDDLTWQNVTLPHDWGVGELKTNPGIFSKDCPGRGATGFIPGGEALIIIHPNGSKGNINLTVGSQGLPDSFISIKTF